MCDAEDTLDIETVEALLALRRPADTRLTALAELLSAAAAPACTVELSGEDRAVAGFRGAYRA